MTWKVMKMFVWGVAYTEKERKVHTRRIKKKEEDKTKNSKDCHNLICINKR